jgi:thiamine monophosphate synthase
MRYPWLRNLGMSIYNRERLKESADWSLNYLGMSSVYGDQCGSYRLTE